MEQIRHLHSWSYALADLLTGLCWPPHPFSSEDELHTSEVRCVYFIRISFFFSDCLISTSDGSVHMESRR
jgi:hypothetical protein